MKDIDNCFEDFINAVENYSNLVWKLSDYRLIPDSKQKLVERYVKLTEASFEVFGKLDGAIQAMKENIELFENHLSSGRPLKDLDLQNEKLISLCEHFHYANRGVNLAKKEEYLDQDRLRQKHQTFLSIMQDFYEALDNYRSKFGGLMSINDAKKIAKQNLYESLEKFDKEMEEINNEN